MSDHVQAMGKEAGAAILKTLPPWLTWAVQPNNLLLVLSIIYVVMQIANLAWKWRREWRARGAAK